MSQRRLRKLPASVLALALAGTAAAQSQPSRELEGTVATQGLTGRGVAAAQLLNAPVGNLFPGNIAIRPDIENPAADDPGSPQRGHRYFIQFNCVGCHAPNGGGGMGPSLSNAKSIYGRRAVDIYLTIMQGRPNGMPAWGGMLPDSIIWDLVTYVQSISREPKPPWGKLTSRTPMRPQIEQVPAEYLTTTTPWRQTTKFGAGKRPFEKPKK